MLFKKSLIALAILLTLVICFSTKIFATPNNTTIEIYQDLTRTLTGNNPNTLLIEKAGVSILNNDLKQIKLFDLEESEADVFITLVNVSKKLFVYKNGKKVNLISLNGINLSSLISNLQDSFGNGKITDLKISASALSSKRVLKNYLDFSEKNNIDKHFKEKVVSDNNLKLYYSASNIDNMGGFATSSTTTTSWKDLSGNNNNGTLTNFALSTASGWDGNNTNPSKLTFDGANDYVKTNNPSPFKFSNTTPFTIEFWISAINQFDHRTVFSCSETVGTNRKSVDIKISGFETLWVNISGNFFNSIFVSAQNQFPYERWTHVTVTYDGLSMGSGVKIYSNGILQSSSVLFDNLIPFTINSPWVLGTPLTGEYGFQGSLGDVRVYNKALSQEEVLQNYQSEQSKYFQGPNIVTLLPANSSTTGIQTDLVITFDQIISKGTGNIRIKKSSNDSTVETINITSNRVTTSGKTATINPVDNLAKNTTYYIEIDQNAFRYNGISFPGISDSTIWNFTTSNDSTQAKVISFSPENGSQDASVASDLVLTFDKDVYPGTGSINIFDIDDGTDLVEVINVNSNLVTSGGTNMITINPSMNLSSDTLYLIAADSPAFQDGAGNNSRPIDIWQFLTVDTTLIDVVSLSPSDDATNVSANTNLQINFNKPVMINTGNIAIKKSSDNSLVETIRVTSGAVTDNGTNTITINPAMDLTSDTQYYVSIDPNAFNDTAGNNYSGIMDNFSWNFKTADIVAPTINSLSPVDNSTKINPNSDLVAVFNEPVKVNTGNITITKLGATVTPPVETISVASNAVTVNGTNTITINPIMDLEEDVNYYINIDATAITDLSGNAFAGILDRGTWNFRTNDVTAPTINTLSPADNAANINVNSNLDVTFSEVVFTKRGNINIFKSPGTLVEMIDVTSNLVTGNGTNIITINPAMDFEENTEYLITIAQGAFTDFYENLFNGILNNTTWNFKTVVPENVGDGNVGGGNAGGNGISDCMFTQCGQLCCINGCCPNNQGTCIDFPDCFASSSSSSSGGSSSSSSSGGSLSSSSSSGSLFFDSDGSLSFFTSPITITGPETIKLNKKKINLSISHANVNGEIKCSVIPIGAVKIMAKPGNFSFTPVKDKIDVKLKINPKAFKKAKKDKSNGNVQIKVLCDDGEGNLDITILP